MTYRTLADLQPAGRRVLLRADLNVPMKDGRVTDATRIERLVPTIQELTGRGARVVVISHFGRPDGRRVAKMSLAPLAPVLGAALGGKPVDFGEDCVGPSAAAVVGRLRDGEVALLENLRFHPEEEANDPGFATQLAALGDLFVNDAFSTAHRAHASTEAVAKRLPSAAGRLMEAELKALAAALEKPKRPLAAIVGGAKVSTKLDLLGNLLGKVDVLVIGGGMANTFLFANGVQIGRSLCEKDMADTARAIAARAAASGKRIVLPDDVVVADKLEAGVAAATVPVDAVPADRMILDVGPRSVAAINAAVAQCRTLVWNGPLGAFETAPFDQGTVAVARAVAGQVAAGRLDAVAGGGDTVAALALAGVEDKLTYVSTAGGAFLEWLEGKTLPGVAALQGS
ncbi:MAG: phosphoglycerate kinase [Alphaproteobacteria bacterium]|nr:phosphoglycerate kinase [Alphaproteobacteria bacterium]